MHAVQNIKCVCKAESDGIFLKSLYLVIHKCQKKHKKRPSLYKRWQGCLHLFHTVKEVPFFKFFFKFFKLKIYFNILNPNWEETELREFSLSMVELSKQTIKYYLDIKYTSHVYLIYTDIKYISMLFEYQDDELFLKLEWILVEYLIVLCFECSWYLFFYLLYSHKGVSTHFSM